MLQRAAPRMGGGWQGTLLFRTKASVGCDGQDRPCHVESRGLDVDAIRPPGVSGLSELSPFLSATAGCMHALRGNGPGLLDDARADARSERRMGAPRSKFGGPHPSRLF